ncbi:MAG: CBS domain-containing protein [Calditerrivibrio sp.]|nr:CBS domain-containing protein [Calditerrivibrio sp.]MCA1981148.1 CBS domain-containing protein [Calditerrivibrio sp.]
MKAKDIMEKFDGRSLNPDMTLKEAVEFMSSIEKPDGSKGIKGMLVLNSGKLIGILSMEDVLKVVIPFYINPLLKDFTWEGMLVNMAAKMQNKKVGDVMNKNIFYVKPEDSLMKCAEILIKYNIQRLPVLENENVVGIILVRDLYNVVVKKILGEINGSGYSSNY